MRILGLVLLVVFASTRAEARNVYLNGVKLDDAVILKNQSFSACDVKFDEAGDVWITAKGVNIALAPVAPAAPVAPVAPVAIKKVWLLASETNRGAAQYTIEVSVNGTRVRTIHPGENASAADITRFVKPGENKLHIVAQKDLGVSAKRLSSSPADLVEVVVGQGDSPGAVTPLVDYKRTAAETTGFTDDFSFAPK